MIYGYENAVQFSVLFKSAGLGYLVGFVFLVLEIIKFSNKKTIITDFIRDIIFFSFSALLFFIFVLKYNSGIFRIYLSGSFISGFILFYIFPGNIIVRRITDIHLSLSERYGKIKEKICFFFYSCCKKTDGNRNKPIKK